MKTSNFSLLIILLLGFSIQSNAQDTLAPIIKYNQFKAKLDFSFTPIIQSDEDLKGHIEGININGYVANSKNYKMGIQLGYHNYKVFSDGISPLIFKRLHFGISNIIVSEKYPVFLAYNIGVTTRRQFIDLDNGLKLYNNYQIGYNYKNIAFASIDYHQNNINFFSKNSTLKSVGLTLGLMLN